MKKILAGLLGAALCIENAMADKPDNSKCYEKDGKICWKKPEGPKSWWEKGWNSSVFAGIMSNENNSDFFFGGKTKIRDAYPIGFAVGKYLANLVEDRLDLEWESQFVQYVGDQDHQEIQPGVVILRWKKFPWNDTLRTTLAVGDGLSIATETPKLEVKQRGKSDSTKVLNYVMVEMTFGLPEVPECDLFLRYHHRSGVFGLYDGVRDAATSFMAGAKVHF